MSYFIELDEYSDKRLRDELERRERVRSRGRCDYCLRLPDTSPCKFQDRHAMAQRGPVNP